MAKEKQRLEDNQGNQLWSLNIVLNKKKLNKK